MAGLFNLRQETTTGGFDYRKASRFDFTKEDSPELASLDLRIEKLHTLNKYIAYTQLNKEEIRLASYQLSRINNTGTVSYRVEDHDVSQQDLKLRVEGSLSELIEKFFDWLIGFFESDEDKKSKSSGGGGGGESPSATIPVVSAEEAKKSPIVKTVPKKLNEYFSAQTKDDLIKEIGELNKTFDDVESFVRLALAFDYEKNAVAGKEALIKNFFDEVFVKMSKVKVPKNEKVAEYEARGFKFGSKVYEVYDASASKEPKAETVKIKGLKDIPELVERKAVCETSFPGKLIQLVPQIDKIRDEVKKKFCEKTKQLNKKRHASKPDSEDQKAFHVAGRMVAMQVSLIRKLGAIIGAFESYLAQLNHPVPKIGSTYKVPEEPPKPKGSPQPNPTPNGHNNVDNEPRGYSGFYDEDENKPGSESDAYGDYLQGQLNAGKKPTAKKKTK